MEAMYNGGMARILLFVGIVGYILYFSLFTIHRYQKLYAHYFDLGIMHQAVYNTYQGIATGEYDRVLEITNPHTTADQVKRMSIHNDIILALIAPLYFIHSGPETLLILQTVVIAFGALYIYLIAMKVIPVRYKSTSFALLFSYSYLLYPGLQKTNNFDFHAVAFAPTFLLAMYYYWLDRKYRWSIFFASMSLLTKEQVGMTVATFGVYTALYQSGRIPQLIQKFKSLLIWKRTSIASSFIANHYSTVLLLIGVVWTVLSMKYIIPFFRGGEHFGTKYFTYLKDDPLSIISVIFRYETWYYLFILFAPLGLLACISLPHLLIIGPELAINILSSNNNMRNIYFHYDAVLIPFIFIASIYGVAQVLKHKFQVTNKFFKRFVLSSRENIVLVYLATTTLIASFMTSPLPWSMQRDIYPWRAAPAKLEDVLVWKEYLKDDQIKVSTTGKLAPHFTSRQYFYDFSWKYEYADYVIIDTYEIEHGFMNHIMRPAYAGIKRDWRYTRVYNNNGIEVYKK